MRFNRGGIFSLEVKIKFVRRGQHGRKRKEVLGSQN